jgi:hypothetical protein
MPSAGVQPAIAEIERPQTYASDRMAVGVGAVVMYNEKNIGIWAVNHNSVVQCPNVYDATCLGFNEKPSLDIIEILTYNTLGLRSQSRKIVSCCI